MKSLIKEIEKVRKSDVADTIRKRAAEFEKFKKKGEKEWFSELCFCLLTANTSAKMGMKMQDSIGYAGFAGLPVEKLTKQLKENGYRFYNVRAIFIAEARKHKGIKKKIQEFDDEREAREWLVENVKGYGYKEASHFLRNVGCRNVAILDRHIINLMREHKMISEAPKSLGKKYYLEIEKKLDGFKEKVGMNHAELDLYMWYMKTGEVLK